MTRTEAKRLRRQLEERYKLDLTAIDRVLELSGQKPLNGSNATNGIEIGGEGRAESAPESTGERFGHANIEFQNEIFKIIEENVTGNFKILDLMPVVERVRPGLSRSTVSFAVSGLVHGGKLHVIQQGRGRRPGIYCKV